MGTRTRSRARLWRDAARHSRRVRWLRVLVPGIACLISIVIAGAVILPNLFPGLGITGFSITMDGLVMNNPRLSGHLGGDRRYSVTAERAIQSLVNPSQLRLENILAEITLGADGWVKIRGREARYDTETEILNLEGGITLTSSKGYTAELASADIYLDEGRLESPEPLRMTSPRGVIDAGRIHVERDGDVIRMRGGVKVTIAPVGEDEKP